MQYFYQAATLLIALMSAFAQPSHAQSAEGQKPSTPSVACMNNYNTGIFDDIIFAVWADQLKLAANLASQVNLCIRDSKNRKINVNQGGWIDIPTGFIETVENNSQVAGLLHAAAVMHDSGTVATARRGQTFRAIVGSLVDNTPNDRYIVGRKPSPGYGASGTIERGAVLKQNVLERARSGTDNRRQELAYLSATQHLQKTEQDLTSFEHFFSAACDGDFSNCINAGRQSRISISPLSTPTANSSDTADSHAAQKRVSLAYVKETKGSDLSQIPLLPKGYRKSDVKTFTEQRSQISDDMSAETLAGLISYLSSDVAREFKNQVIKQLSSRAPKPETDDILYRYFTEQTNLLGNNAGLWQVFVDVARRKNKRSDEQVAQAHVYALNGDWGAAEQALTNALQNPSNGDLPIDFLIAARANFSNAAE